MKNFIEVTESNGEKAFLNVLSILKINAIPENKCRIYLNVKRNPPSKESMVFQGGGSILHSIDVQESYDQIKEKLL